MANERQTPPEVLKKIREAELTNATKLDLSSSKLKEIPEELSRLQNLTTLSLGGNRLTSIPEHLSRLQNLTELYLYGNQLTSIPEHLSHLQNLTRLDLGGNQLTSIPEHLSRLQNLTSLNLSGNQLTSIPEHLSRLQNLTTLILGGNQLTSIPEHLSRLQNLTGLSLRENQLTSIPEFLLDLPGFTALEATERFNYGEGILNVADNPIATPPQEILAQGLEAARDYYRQRQEVGTEQLYEAKLLIVGEPKAGKTTLTQKIQNPDYQLEPIPSTEGIDIARWQFTHPDGSPFRVNIWDFGGQEIYQATHQFFLTKRSCYALVTNTRREDANIYYWLSVIKLLADDSPVLIVKNEEGDRARDLNYTKLRGEFEQLQDRLATNLATNRGLPELLDRFCHYLANLPHIGDPLPKTWVRVREALETDPRNTISRETYLKLCDDNKITQHDYKLQLSQYLHDLGVFLHFQDDDLLAKTIILKPTWGTDAVYKVLDNDTVIANQGCFSRTDLDNIWSADEYSGLRGELLQLMMKFQLCYALPHRPNQPKRYIAPQLLPEEQPDYRWDETDNRILRYTYDFMPKGILTRFIVALHENIESDPKHQRQTVWRTGVILTKDNTRAEVVEFYEKREIKIRLQGDNKRGLLEIVTHELDKIHASFHRLKYNQLIPCNCAVCQPSQDPHSYPLEVLKRFVSNNQTEIQCQKGFGMVDVYGLIDDIGDRAKLLRDRYHDTANPFAPENLPTRQAMTPENEPTPPPTTPPSTLEEALKNIKDPMTWVKATVAVLVATGAAQIPPLITPQNPTPEDETVTEIAPADETTEDKTEQAATITQQLYIGDDSNGEAIERVEVLFEAPEGPVSEFTDSDGFVTLQLPQQPNIDITLSRTGYETEVKTLNLTVDPGKRKYFLKPAAQ